MTPPAARRFVPLAGYFEAVVAQVGQPTPVGTVDAFLGEPTVRLDKDGRARPYAAVYPGPGWLHGASLNRDSDTVTVTFQVTAAGGDIARYGRAVDRVRAALTGWAPTVPGLACGPLTEPESYDPGPARIDKDVMPSRTWAPLLFTGQIWLPEPEGDTTP